MSKIIGIDLGTTNSAVAVLEGNEAKSSLTQKETVQHLLLYHSKWRNPSRGSCKTSSCDKPKYDFINQTPYR